MTALERLLLLAVRELIEHAQPANLPELEDEDPDQFAAWQTAQCAVAVAESGECVQVVRAALAELHATLATSCA